MAKKINNSEGFALRVTDSALFGGRVKNHAAGCKCIVCGAPKRLHRWGGNITTNIHATLQACGDCLMRGLA